jgi:hypothetical protein
MAWLALIHYQTQAGRNLLKCTRRAMESGAKEKTREAHGSAS